ncbi:flavodoxin [Dysgonomonas massiliensis]|uniref:flavodoxin n=1 Tax=Dysgonomonas massiliensis TaxID=2040292 RepID=UPI000C78747F|nr:flavodoxin [Dysgonomonas massiliensis]
MDKKIAIVYGSSTGTTKSVAEKIEAAFGGAELFNAEDVSVDSLKDFDLLIFGASTEGVGDLQYDWDTLLPKVAKMDFSGKKVALFGLGDSASFSTSFAGAMAVIYKALKGKVEVIGMVSTDGYTFDDSDAVEGDKFVGLAIDEDNEYDKTDERVNNWVADLKAAL